jgi:hypothetical protein
MGPQRNVTAWMDLDLMVPSSQQLIPEQGRLSRIAQRNGLAESAKPKNSL